MVFLQVTLEEFLQFYSDFPMKLSPFHPKSVHDTAVLSLHFADIGESLAVEISLWKILKG